MSERIDAHADAAERRRKQAERIQRRMLANLANAVDLDDVKAVVAELIKRTIR